MIKKIEMKITLNRFVLPLLQKYDNNIIYSQYLQCLKYKPYR